MITPNTYESRPRPPTPDGACVRTAAVRPRPFRVIVGIDFSGASLAAARWVARAFGSGTDLVLVHVLPPTRRLPASTSPARGAVARDDARVMLGALRGLAGTLGVGRVEAVVRLGTVPDALAAVAASPDSSRRRTRGRAAMRRAARRMATIRLPTRARTASSRSSSSCPTAWAGTRA
jgi:hypothetical protein